MEQGVVFIDNQNRIAYCNPATVRIRGIKLEEARGESILNVHPFSAREKVIQIIESLKSGQIKGHQRMKILNLSSSLLLTQGSGSHTNLWKKCSRGISKKNQDPSEIPKGWESGSPSFRKSLNFIREKSGSKANWEREAPLR